MTDALAERDSDLVAQRARTSEVTASVAEIQRRLGSLAMNPQTANQNMASPSRELHRRNSLRGESNEFDDVTNQENRTSYSGRNDDVDTFNSRRSNGGSYGDRGYNGRGLL